MTTHTSSTFLQRPSTRPGWWALGLAIAFEVMNIINSAVFMRLSENVPWRQTVLPFYGIFMMLCGVSAGIVGLIAILRSHERSWLVWLAVLVGAFALLFILAEFLIPH
jgi:4-amino-4-deoxy-L-arabinose transferase-like glycosyltransferase